MRLPTRTLHAAVWLLAWGVPALAQEAPKGASSGQSIAGNTQQAAGQLAQINKKLDLILQRMDGMARAPPPLVIPAALDCKAGDCDRDAKAMCARFGYADGKAAGLTTASSTVVCLDGP